MTDFSWSPEKRPITDAMVSEVDRGGRIELHYAAVEGDLPLVRALLAAGADPNARDQAGMAPLHFATQMGISRVPVAAELLRAGAEVDARDKLGNTPLWKALFEAPGDGEMIQLLRGAGADPYSENNAGQSVLSYARYMNSAQWFADLPETP